MTADEHLSRLDLYLQSRCESALLDFKARFDPSSTQNWCEILKDIIAMANSGGGIIVVDVDDDGVPTNEGVEALLSFDPAEISKKIEKYTDSGFSDFRVVAIKAYGASVACFAIGATHIPLVFCKPGTYPIAGTTQQKTAFGQGTLYFRHGAKSEHANQNDLREFLERELDRVREQWLGNLRKVVEAPSGAQVVVVNQSANPVAQLQNVKLCASNEAPMVRGLDPNKTHPYRQKEVIGKLAEHGIRVLGPDIQAIRLCHGLDDRIEFCFKPKFGTTLYSEQFIDWAVEQHNKKPDFFTAARQGIKRVAAAANPNDERLVWLRKHMEANGLSIARMANILKIGDGTLSRLFRCQYKGDIEKMLGRIEEYRTKCQRIASE